MTDMVIERWAYELRPLCYMAIGGIGLKHLPSSGVMWTSAALLVVCAAWILRLRWMNRKPRGTPLFDMAD